ncbi:hypothetical protein AVEN_200178-1 [Araneus ventricosus]|uniref:Uncharacterized protein n=1 Tax=Araneus ventricosus TaxID=182803 RepID=A0A4Y2MF80_ARAVE|nr:hypothetical protein AVEN_200178-1 [Araneus ventricosus]
MFLILCGMSSTFHSRINSDDKILRLRQLLYTCHTSHILVAQNVVFVYTTKKASRYRCHTSHIRHAQKMLCFVYDRKASYTLPCVPQLQHKMIIVRTRRKLLLCVAMRSHPL